MKKIILLMASALLALVTVAIPGRHIDNQAAAKRAVSQYADDSFKFRAVVYQALLDRSLWSLTVEAHNFLMKKPQDPEREASFAEAYWSLHRLGVKEGVPRMAQSELDSWYEEAVRVTKSVAQQNPQSVSAHLVYGQYLLYFVPGQDKVKPMIQEFQLAERLRPNLGETHYWLAEAYLGTGDYSSETAHNAIKEAKTALALDPHLTECYYDLATAYSLDSVHDYQQSRFYLEKYLTLHPQYKTRQDIVNFSALFSHRLSTAP